jgi:hypothetical protein
MHGSSLSRAQKSALFLGVTFLFSSYAWSQEVNPATAQEGEHREAQEPQGEAQKNEPPSPHLRSWEIPETVVKGKQVTLDEEELIGPNKQPRWTAARRFPSTRVYVQPPGVFDFEFWTRVKVPREGQSTIEHQYEVEMGLPNRFQVDVYAVTEKEGSEGEIDLSEQKFEVRYAFADWGEIWGNPTAYLEWVEVSEGVDVVEYKLLLGGEAGPGWHWGTNFVLEHEVSGDLTNEHELTLGLSRTIQDSKLSLGGEVKASLTDVHSDRGNYEESLEVGPSLQYRPLPAMHIDLAPLVGIGPESRAMDIYFVIGWEF